MLSIMNVSDNFILSAVATVGLNEMLAVFISFVQMEERLLMS